jgi:hypothetical protein
MLAIKYALFCGVFAYEGFKNGVTLTNLGMRKGWVARVYAVFYLLFVLLGLPMIVLALKKVLATGCDTLKLALLFAATGPQLALVFIGLALFLFLIKQAAIYFSKKKQPRNEASRKMINSMILFPFAIGIYYLLGLPQLVLVGIWGYFIFFGAFTSPRVIKEAMPVREGMKWRFKHGVDEDGEG